MGGRGKGGGMGEESGFGRNKQEFDRQPQWMGLPVPCILKRLHLPDRVNMVSQSQCGGTG